MAVYQSTYSFCIIWNLFCIYIIKDPLNFFQTYPGGSSLPMVYLAIQCNQPINESIFLPSVGLPRSFRWSSLQLLWCECNVVSLRLRSLAGTEMERVWGWNRLGRNGYLHIYDQTIYFHQTYQCCNNFWDLMTLKLVHFFFVCFSMRDAVYFTNMHHFQNWLRDIVKWGGGH